MPITAKQHDLTQALPDHMPRIQTHDKALETQKARVADHIRAEATRQHELFLQEGRLDWERGEKPAIDSAINAFIERLTKTPEGRTALTELDTNRPYMKPWDRDAPQDKKALLAQQALEEDATKHMGTDPKQLEKPEHNGINTGTRACVEYLRQCKRHGNPILNSLAAQATITNSIKTSQSPEKYLNDRKTENPATGGLTQAEITDITASINAKQRGTPTP